MLATTTTAVVVPASSAAAGDGTRNVRATSPSAITTTWLWDNAVDPAVDARGTGYAAASPTGLVTFAREHDLRTVHVSAPWASDEGPVASWLTESLVALRGAGVDAGVLGGDPPWLDDPALAVRWMLAATHDRPVTHVQLDVEPWTLPAWQSDQRASALQWVQMLDEVRAALPAGVELAVDAPWWLVTIPDPEGEGTLFDAVLRRVDRVGIVTFIDHARGETGVLAKAEAAVEAADAAGVPYTIGLETDTPEVAGGAEFTFYDEGWQALERESRVVAAALEDRPGFRGVAVEHYRSWQRLLATG